MKKELTVFRHRYDKTDSDIYIYIFIYIYIYIEEEEEEVLEALETPEAIIMKVADLGISRASSTVSLSLIDKTTIFLLAIFYIER